MNRELSRILIFLGAPGAVPKTVQLLNAALGKEEQLHYIAELRNLRAGWTTPDRRAYVQWWSKPRDTFQHGRELTQWFADVGRTYVDGAWMNKYLREFRADALASLSASERQELASVLAAPVQSAQQVPAQPRSFVREWTLADLLPDIGGGLRGRDFERGRQIFADAQCISCHRMGNDGGVIGPELTGAADKYDARSLLESMLEPSKVIAEQYQYFTVFTKSGDSYTGRIVSQTPARVLVEVDPLAGTRESIPGADVERVAPAALSPMPEGLLNGFTREEILDLLAYLRTGGRPDKAAR